MPSCNSYGWSGGFAAIATALAWHLTNDKGCTVSMIKLFSDAVNMHHQEMFRYSAIGAGILLFVLSFFNVAELLHEVVLLFIAAVLGIITVSGLMFYSTYMDMFLSCGPSVLDRFSLNNNIFEARDQVGITIFLLDLIGGFLLFLAAISFTKRY